MCFSCILREFYVENLFKRLLNTMLLCYNYIIIYNKIKKWHSCLFFGEGKWSIQPAI